MTEVFVTVVIVGIVSAAVIPMIIASGEDAHKKAVFKETISMLRDIMRGGMISDELDEMELFILAGTGNRDYFMNRINSLKTCLAPIGSLVIPPGCMFGIGEGAVILPNGTHLLFGATPSGRGFRSVIIDWNGSKDPNCISQDQLAITLNYRSTTLTFSNTTPIKSGAISPPFDLEAPTIGCTFQANGKLYKQIYE